MGVIKRFVIIIISIISISFEIFAQTGVGDNFNDNTVSCNWNGNTAYTFTESGAEFKVNATVSSGSYLVFELQFTAVNISANPVLTIKFKSSTAITARIDLQDAAGKSTNSTPISKSIPGTGVYNTYTYNFAGNFNQTYPSTSTVDPTQIAKIQIFINPGGTAFTGSFNVDDLQLGTGGVTDGGGSACPAVPPPPPSSITSDIRLNQIGFYPNCSKVAIFKGTPSGTNFYVRSLDLTTTYYTGTVSASSTWSFSAESVRAADFSSFNTPGTYRIDIPGVGCSYSFTIANKIFNLVNKTALKAYYQNRSSTATTTPYAGVWARAMGHPDLSVQIHSSAASAGRPAGTVVSSPGGWYDAGDYNSYVVNSGISTYTLLAAYEHYKSYYDTLNSNIPESGGTYPDILDEIKWNLDWMLTMQDPGDSGVYHKKTCAAFDAFIMPSASTCQRYLVGKGSAAAFDFAAVMATAYRVYKPYNPTYANTCLKAAKGAYKWGVANPNVSFSNPGGISTGEYGDGSLGDEMEWAASELYISTLNNTYYTNSFKNGNSYGVPDWATVRTLGLYSLVFHRKELTSVGSADTTNMKNKLTNLADTYKNHQMSGSAYRVAMGAGGGGDFAWGSNAVAANQGMLLMQAYEVTKNIDYYNAGIANLDYLLGRNATTYNFVTGFGTTQVMNPHHRQSYADGIVNPVPGFLAGGPQNGATGDGCANNGNPALAYVDMQPCYTKNEVAINWNAPFVFLSAAPEAISPCGIALPVSLFEFTGELKEDKVKLLWLTATEVNNKGFIIERSSDGEKFAPIGFVNGKNGYSIQEYNYTDASPIKGIGYYRLKQEDNDGQISYSGIISVDNNHEFVKVYPNPAKDEINISIQQGSYSLVISDMSGRVILEDNIVNAEALISKSYHVSQLNAGMYVLQVRSADQVKSIKILIEK